ncbi:MAG TPA: transglutaminase domain-containing protein, partial [Bacillota bacterium]|nr:transglutaminase domain-containing protein [Bacillota bacterium]
RPGGFEDHWICEYWDGQQQRWVGVDPQIDTLQKELFKLNFNPLDLPDGQFICGARAWQLCRQGQEEPGKFGIFQFNGMGFIRGNLIRDLAALNKMELLPVDFWGLMQRPDKPIPESDAAMLDGVARLITAEDPKLYEVYRWDEFRVPSRIYSFTPQGMVQVEIPV